MSMVKTVLSQDILGVCLLMAEGNLDMTLGEIAVRVEQWESKSNRYFGTGSPDFSNLLRRLVYRGGDSENWQNHINEVTLKESALKMLSYEDVYFNDEGESWHSREEFKNPEIYHIEELFEGDEDAYLDKLIARKLMVKFFEDLNGAGCPVADVRELMARANITTDLLYKCSAGISARND